MSNAAPTVPKLRERIVDRVIRVGALGTALASIPGFLAGAPQLFATGNFWDAFWGASGRLGVQFVTDADWLFPSLLAVSLGFIAVLLTQSVNDRAAEELEPIRTGLFIGAFLVGAVAVSAWELAVASVFARLIDFPQFVTLTIVCGLIAGVAISATVLVTASLSRQIAILERDIAGLRRYSLADGAEPRVRASWWRIVAWGAIWLAIAATIIIVVFASSFDPSRPDEIGYGILVGIEYGLLVALLAFGLPLGIVHGGQVVMRVLAFNRIPVVISVVAALALGSLLPIALITTIESAQSDLRTVLWIAFAVSVGATLFVLIPIRGLPYSLIRHLAAVDATDVLNRTEKALVDLRAAASPKPDLIARIVKAVRG